MNISKGRTNQQLQFRKISFSFIVLLLAGLAAAASGCSANPQTGIEVSAAYDAVEAAAEEQAVEVQQMAAPENLAAPEATPAQSNEAGDTGLAEAYQAVIEKQNSAPDQPAEVQPAAPTAGTQPLPTEQPAASTAAEQPAPAQALPPAEPKVGFLAPDLTLTALDGSSIRLSDLRGKNVLLNYWVTWCIPCMDELPILSQLSLEYQAQNVVILAVNGIEQDQLGAVQQLVSDMGLAQPVLLDENESLWTTYLVQFLPTSFFIDTQGVIRHIMLGSAPEDVIRTKLEQLIVNQL